MQNESPAIDVQQLNFRYGQRLALDQLELRVPPGQIFALLGPNGSGKTTLFRILATLERAWTGSVHVLGFELRVQAMKVRELLGVVFQAPSLDGKLTVRENLRCQGILYGLSGRDLNVRMQEVVQQLGLVQRMSDRVDTLSGGLKRRVELAKGMLHRPRLLLMDEPSTGLDPASRLDLWRALLELQEQHRVTVILTTHLLEEADKADQIAILDQGKNVACGPPEQLRRELGSQILTVQAQVPQPVMDWLIDRNFVPQSQGNSVRVAGDDVSNLVAPLCESFGNQLVNISVGRPSLEDVFIARTGHRFWNASLGE